VDQSTPSSPTRQFDSVRNQLAQEDGLSFLRLLSKPMVENACRHLSHRWRDRIYTPWITLGIFLSQVLSADQSCDQAIDRFQKCRYDQNLPKVATDTASYCEARLRLPEELIGNWSDGPARRSSRRRNRPGSFTDERSRSPTALPS
jgi:hypothetical protein